MSLPGCPKSLVRVFLLIFLFLFFSYYITMGLDMHFFQSFIEPLISLRHLLTTGYTQNDVGDVHCLVNFIGSQPLKPSDDVTMALSPYIKFRNNKSYCPRNGGGQFSCLEMSSSWQQREVAKKFFFSSGLAIKALSPCELQKSYFS